MTRLNFHVDQTTLLKAYQLSTLRPQQWEEVDEEFLDQDASDDSHPLHRVEVEDPLGLGGGVSLKDLDVATRATLSITSKSFSPSQFLSTAYPNATYHDLVLGAENLQRSLDEREESVMNLVEDNLDSFVSVKSAMDSLCTVMRQEILAPETAHATQPLRHHLKRGAEKASQIFLPVLETASKAHKLRTTLGVFERSRFFFNLPSFIMESIDAGKYDLALRDYKKGKYLFENRPNQLLPIASSDPSTQRFQQQQQRKILNRVWSNVEKAMDEMRNVLVSRLQDSGGSVEEHEKTLETLMDLHSSADSAWAYFDSHQANILKKMGSAYEAGADVVKNSLQKNSSSSESSPAADSLGGQLKLAVHRLETRQSDAVVSRSAADATWHALLHLVKSVSSTIINTLPSFWRISKGLIDGKFRKPNSINRSSDTERSPAQCRSMASDIIGSYVSLLSQALIRHNSLVQSVDGSDPTAQPLPSLFPRNSHSLATAYHLQRIFNEIQDCVTELAALNISDEVSAQLKAFIAALRWSFMDALTQNWVQDAGAFYHLESWITISSKTRSPNSASTPQNSVSTHLLTQFEIFQRHVTTSLYRLALDSHHLPLSSVGAKERPAAAVDQAVTQKIARGFLDAVYRFLDGLMVLVSDEVQLATFEPPSEFLLEKGASLAESMDLQDPNVRLLVVIANLDFFRKAVIPGMILELENAFGASLAEDMKVLESVIDELDKTLHGAYIKPRVSAIKDKLHFSILGTQVDWCRPGQPVVIRQYVFELLNYLVEVHAQVCGISPSLLDRTINALLGELAKEISRCFDSVRRFGTSGLLLAVLEMTFIHKSLGRYGRDSRAGRMLEDLYTKQVPKKYMPSASDHDFQTAFEAMQKVLSESRRATDIQFLCFRKSSTKEKNGTLTDVIKVKNKNKVE